MDGQPESKQQTANDILQASDVINQNSFLDKQDQDFVLCLKCFSSGNIPNILSHTDFIKIEFLKELDTKPSGDEQLIWTEDDTATLLKVLQKSGADWDRIHKILPKRTKHEILRHYLQLPLESIASIIIPEHTGSLTQKEHTEEVRTNEEPLPANEYSNSILQHVN